MGFFLLDILASLGSVITAATQSTAQELALLNQQDSADPAVSAEDSTPAPATPGYDSNATVNAEQMKEAARKRVWLMNLLY